MPSPSEWREHKSQILALIAENNLTTVVEQMKEHRFTASKAQYEQQLVKWNARKNLKNGEWRSVIAAYDSLVTRHGERNVRLLISDIHIGKLKISRARRRYCREESQAMDLITESDIDGHLPRGVSFQVLRAHGDWISPLPDELGIEHSSTPGSPTVSNRSIPPASLHGAAALDDVLDVEIPDLVPSSPFPAFTIWESLGNLAIPSTAASDPIASLSLVGPSPGSLSPFNFSPGQFDFNSAIWSDAVAVNNNHKTPKQILRDLGFFQFEKQLLEGTGTTNTQTWLAGHVHFLQLLSCVKVLRRSPFDLIDIQLAGDHYIQSLMQPFMSLLPGEDQSTAQVTDLNAHIHRLLLFSFANGFAGLEMVDLTRVLGFLGQYKNIGALLMQLKGIPGPYSKAIAVGVFKLCVESGETQVAQQLLDTKKIDVNAFIFSPNGNRLTPLETASHLQDANMIHILLENGADVNKSFWSETGPLSRLLYGFKTGATINPVARHAISQLLDAGARVKFSDLRLVLESLHAKDVGFKLALSLLDQSPEAWLSNDSLPLAARELDEDQISQILNSILPKDDTNKENHRGHSRNSIHQALVECAVKGYSQLVVEMLLHHDTHPVTGVLCGAIRGRRKDLVGMIISEYASTLISESHNVNLKHHPLAEAIRVEDDDLVRFCEENESLCHLQDHHFKEALDAAASTGNLKYVCKLLEHFRYPNPSVLTRPHLHAIQGGHKDIYMMLLNAGADVNSNQGSDPFMAAITQGDRSLVSAIMDANLSGRSHYNINGDSIKTLSPLIRLGDQSLIIKALHVMPSCLKLEERDVEDIVISRQHGMFQFLLDQKAFRHTAITARLKLAARSNDGTTVREMLSLGANPGNLRVLI
ncbi:hypothetical protein PG996_013884 [Apiospora saccharicola]|uniref:Clr5 domain-containing protein n=1 Tax=Apiospora saccharicola TaxID=335842 RepID=A0ABR1TGR2_9PEZI